jgi:hypothetical protein
MNELIEKLLESNRQGYEEIVAGIKSLQDYLSNLVAPPTDPDQERIDPQDLPELVHRAIADAANTLQSPELNDALERASQGEPVEDLLRSLIKQMEIDRDERHRKEQQKLARWRGGQPEQTSEGTWVSGHIRRRPTRRAPEPEVEEPPKESFSPPAPAPAGNLPAVTQPAPVPVVIDASPAPTPPAPTEPAPAEPPKPGDKPPRRPPRRPPRQPPRQPGSPAFGSQGMGGPGGDLTSDRGITGSLLPEAVATLSGFPELGPVRS